MFKIILNKKHDVRRMFVYSETSIAFIHKQFYYPEQFHGDTKLNENIIQELLSNWIIGVFEVYESLMLWLIL